MNNDPKQNIIYLNFLAKMGQSKSSMFGHSMFGMLDVQYFGVRSTSRIYGMA